MQPHRVKIPIELKLLACLRMLGRGECADTVAELSEIPASTLNVIFKKFIKNFSLALVPSVIKMPEGDDLKRGITILSF